MTVPLLGVVISCLWRMINVLSRLAMALLVDPELVLPSGGVPSPPGYGLLYFGFISRIIESQLIPI